MTSLFRVVLAAWLLIASALALPAVALAQEVEFGQPQARAVLGQPITFSTTIESASEPQAVELLLRLPGERAVSVLPAQVSGSGQTWSAEARLEGHVPPNSSFSYRFRARDVASGEETLGPEAQAVVRDERFAWRTLEGGIIRLHWYEGDEAFAGRALQIGEEAVANASELLGVTETEPIDFFIYDSEASMRVALGPGTRENVGGQAHADIRTLFGLIEPHEVNSEWVDTLVSHELTHLVFDTATDNPYHSPPRWLNEGVAVLLSEGHTPAWRSAIDNAVRQGSLIPLDGLGGLFPTTAEQFRLAYAESVSAVDFFVGTYDEPTLWSLVRSYAQGVSDDEAFEAATGADLAAFNAAWMGSLGVDVPQPLGPQPGPPGPLPAGWDTPEGTPRPTLAPGATPDPSQAPPPATARPLPTPGEGEGDPRGDNLLLGLGAGVAVVLGVVALALVARRRLLT
ncbi:MAG TPA: peptidase MA family metallohydrolase [Candidatus Limnocylindria bacterium]|nr:peptidase MA family metallohydrolase [Candidatus Limnocylindria bacterium]